MLDVILAVAVAILKVLLPMLFDAANAKPTAETGKSDPTRDALRARVLETWGRAKAGGALLLVLACLCLAGCQNTRTIYVRDGEPVRLRETLRGAKIWALDSEGVPVPGTMDLPEGWYALPVPGADNTTR